ncbi:MAG: hypothetical protein Kow00117_18340 [Phototrophicales bacterium]
MAFKVEWVISGRILLVDLSDNITIEEFERAVYQAMFEVDRAGEPPFVHVIFQSLYGRISPTNLQQMKRITESYFRNPRLGYTIVISTDEVYRFLSGLTAQIYHSRWRAFDSVQEGIAFLQAIDKTLAQVC